VLAAHLLPLGPKYLDLNEAVAASGMAIFFTLSGFLITRFLTKDDNVQHFLIRRFLRIAPLAWLGMTLATLLAGGSTEQYFANLSFFANLPPFPLLPAGGHFWSLCLEVQFYAGVALLVTIGKQRALLILPLLCLGITSLRITYQEPLSIVSWFRLDEILAGATLALIYEGWLGTKIQRLVARGSIFSLFALLIASGAEWGGALNYLRPYFAALVVGASLYSAPAWMDALSRWRPVTYVAQISYALYVFHGILMDTWLGTGDNLVKYAKRPLLLALTCGLAHLSTFYFERFWMDQARRLTKRTAAVMP
jgi:peptidoglycan/LPS O-acetylase OafA/YrhL